MGVMIGVLWNSKIGCHDLFNGTTVASYDWPYFFCLHIDSPWFITVPILNNPVVCTVFACEFFKDMSLPHALFNGRLSNQAVSNCQIPLSTQTRSRCSDTRKRRASINRAPSGVLD
jgi:hypothetical protein